MLPIVRESPVLPDYGVAELRWVARARGAAAQIAQEVAVCARNRSLRSLRILRVQLMIERRRENERSQWLNPREALHCGAKEARVSEVLDAGGLWERRCCVEHDVVNY